MQDAEPDRENERQKNEERQKAAAYQSIRFRLQNIRQTERFRDKQARKRTGITQPASYYDRPPEEISPRFEEAMQRLWDIGTIDKTGRADTELRRTYHLIAKGKAPLTEADVIKLGLVPECRLRLLLGWLAHRLNLVEAQDHVDLGEEARTVVTTEEI